MWSQNAGVGGMGGGGWFREEQDVTDQRACKGERKKGKAFAWKTVK